jgi:hypothetical protein
MVASGRPAADRHEFPGDLSNPGIEISHVSAMFAPTAGMGYRAGESRAQTIPARKGIPWRSQQ